MNTNSRDFVPSSANQGRTDENTQNERGGRGGRGGRGDRGRGRPQTAGPPNST